MWVGDGTALPARSSRSRRSEGLRDLPELRASMAMAVAVVGTGQGSRAKKRGGAWSGHCRGVGGEALPVDEAS